MAHSAGPVRRFRSLLWKPGLDEEIADELAFHLEMRAREYAARGLAPAAATAAARRRFGDVGRVKAECSAIGGGRDRAQRRARWLAELGRDLRLAGRRLGERPGPTLLAVVALTAGLAGAATAWRIARAVLRPLPFAEPASLVRLRQVSPAGVDFAASVPDFADWRRFCRSFAGIAAFETAEANLTGPGTAAEPPERVLAARATASLLPLLGGQPLLGRGFAATVAAPGGNRRVAVLSHALWRRRFGADPQIVGSTLWLDGVPLRIAGVMPAGFAAPPGVGLWVPLVRPAAAGSARDHHRLEVLARLRPGVSVSQAAADLAAVAATAARFHPETNQGWGARVEALPAAWIGPRWTRRARLLLAAAALLWLLASATAANLLWARAAARQREIDLRAALGGGRGRIVRQLFAEGLLLALLGAVGGLLLSGAATAALRQAAAGVPQLAGLAAPGPPGLSALSAGRPQLDLGTAGLVLALALLSSVVCGLGPALQALRPGHEAVRQSARLTTRREGRVRDALVVAELACATTLLVAAGLLLESYLRLDRADPGFDADHVLSLRLALNGERYSPAERRALLRRLEERLGQLPGVAAAGFVSTAPLAAERTEEPFTLDPRPAGEHEFREATSVATGDGRSRDLAAEWRVVTPGCFRALGLRRIAGRLLEPADRDVQHPVAVVDSTFAGRAWPGANPLGRRLRRPGGGRELTVVGVVAPVRDVDLEAGPRPVLFLPYEQVPWRAMALVVRPAAGPPPSTGTGTAAPWVGAGAATAAGRAALDGAVRGQIAAVDAGLPVSAARWLEVARRQEAAGPRLGSWLVALFAAAALGLAVSGVYATAAAAVVQRTPEIAVRQALGAARGDVRRLVLGRGAVLTLLGLALGSGGALLFSRLLAGLLYETPATRVGTYAGAALLLGGVALLASAFPARRAAGIAPALALRRE
ncbi:MAG TPA: ADOP family duplicated permease [Thermoanaerobaculia bacterium]|jgi:predicted permease|nr:ADOP family duplicated permease [Thermoanaerobaculia bacterium]